MRTFFVVLFFVNYLNAATVKIAQDSRILSAVENPDKMKSTISAAFKSLGYDVQFVEMPIIRSLQMLDDGSIDAEVISRATVIENKFKNVIKIPTLITNSKLYLFSFKDSEINLKSEEQLSKGSFLLVRGHLIGKKYSTDNKLKNVVEIGSVNQVIEMLIAGRADYSFYLEDQKTFEKINASRLNEKNKVYFRSTPLLEAPTYFYVHKRHQKDLDRLTKYIQENYK